MIRARRFVVKTVLAAADPASIAVARQVVDGALDHLAPVIERGDDGIVVSVVVSGRSGPEVERYALVWLSQLAGADALCVVSCTSASVA